MSKDNLRIAVCGAAGRMGRKIMELILDAEDLTLSGAIEYATHPDIDKDVGTLLGRAEIGQPLESNVEHVAAASDVVIDFSHADVTIEVAQAVAKEKKALVIGTTGHEDMQRNEILEEASEIPLVWAPNMSVGVTLMFGLAARAAKILGEDYDVEVVEMHHRHKKDAPSGTAMKLAQVLADAREKSLTEHGIFTRHGMTGERPTGHIGVQTLRGGDVVGEHTALYVGDGERLEITHRATSREIFARGAVRAARWVYGKHAGLYDMFDVLGLGDI